MIQLGPYELPVPVVLAPMAGITNPAFRQLCLEQGAGLYVCEMITSRGLIERDKETMRMVQFHPEEHPRSLQLYGVDPAVVAQAVEMVLRENIADHIDINMGCPVAKVTRKGGGAALPWKLTLFRAIIRQAVQVSRRVSEELGRPEVPVTVKMRKGIDDDHLTYVQAGHIAAEEGAAWVALHGRTAAQMYGGTADWDAIATLKQELAPTGVPVLGNGDIWTAQDALDLVAHTNADGVVVGRGCLGRPWLFGQLAAAFQGEPLPPNPRLPEVLQVMLRHVELLADLLGENRGCRDFRKHVSWYLKGFSIGSKVRASLGMASSLAEIRELVSQIDADQDYPGDIAALPRGRTTGQRQVRLPYGWLDSQTDLGMSLEEFSEAEIGVSGG